MRLPIVLLLLLSVPSAAQQPRNAQRASAKQYPAKGAEIMWDTYGVPHIFAADDRALLRAFGWAQMQNHADLLLRVIGTARARASEYWRDTTYLRSDLYLRHARIDELAAAVLRDQQPQFRALIDAFVAGINEYARTHRAEITDSFEVVLPVTTHDVFANMVAVQLLFSQGNEQVAAFDRGSNGWAIAPAKSASGHAMLLADPHLPWSGSFTWTEAQLESPTTHEYGAALIASPVLNIAFNNRVAWTHTVNTTDSEDYYDLGVVGDGYRWQGATRAFVLDTQRMSIKQADGSVRDTLIVRRQSVHGPVLGLRGERALAVRRYQPTQTLLQSWEMGHARDLAEFNRALDRNAIAGQNVVYADADGNVMYFYGGIVPKRADGDYAKWNRNLPGDTAPEALWTNVHAASELPRLINPPTGWVQNANDPPWFSTYPSVLKPADYPAYVAPVMLGLRPQRSIRMLVESGKLTFDDVVRLKHSTYMELADRVLPDLIAAARTSGAPARAAAADVLEKWDRSADNESRGGTLFAAWYAAMTSRQGVRLFKERWQFTDPIRTPRGLADTAVALRALDAAASIVAQRYGSVDVAWGVAHRFARDTVDLPGNGAASVLGIFRVVGFPTRPAGVPIAVSGDSYVAVVEFSNPIRAATLIPYGNASQTGSVHRTDQLRFASEKRLRPTWRTRAEIAKHLERRDVLR